MTMRRLQSARKAWKVFTNMLQTQLLKLNRSRAFKKVPSKSQLTKTSKKVSWPTFLIQPRRKNKKFLLKTSQKLRYRHHHHHHHHYLQSRPSPVYINQLFLEPITMKDMQPSNKKIAQQESHKEICSTSAKTSDLINEQGSMTGTSNQDNETVHTADDMWESLLLASPQMHGINERAEEFIARFRAEMQHQEILARR